MPAATQELRTGTIDSFYDADSGLIKDSVTGEKFDFFHPGAQVEFVTQPGIIDGQPTLTFIKITLPNGRVIVNEIKKKPN